MGSPASRNPPLILSEEHLPGHLRQPNRAFQGIPGVEGARGGRLWATWYGGGTDEGVENAVLLATTESLGTAWEFVFAVDTPGEVRCFDPCLWLDPAGKLWLFWAQAIPHGKYPYVWAMVADRLELSDANWSEPFEVCPGVMMNKPTVLSTGAIVLPVSNWRRKRYADQPEAVTAECYSLDLMTRKAEFLGGAASDQESKCYDEQMVVERLDGSLWMWVRTCYGIGESTSTNHGKTWTPVTPSRVLHTNSRFFIRRLRSGNLLLVKHGGACEAVGRTNLQALLSKDDGETWIGGLLLDAREYASYPDGFEDEQGRICIAYDYGRTTDKELLMAVFREEEVEQKSLFYPDSKLRLLINKSYGTAPKAIAE